MGSFTMSLTKVPSILRYSTDRFLRQAKDDRPVPRKAPRQVQPDALLCRPVHGEIAERPVFQDIDEIDVGTNGLENRDNERRIGTGQHGTPQVRLRDRKMIRW
jgi:hypothetical protein